jgi:hypothetical protein
MDWVGVEATTSASLRLGSSYPSKEMIGKEKIIIFKFQPFHFAALSSFLLLRPMGRGLFRLKNSFVTDLKSG